VASHLVESRDLHSMGIRRSPLRKPAILPYSSYGDRLAPRAASAMTSQTQKTKAKGPVMKTALMKTALMKTSTIKIAPVMRTTTVIKSAAVIKTAPLIQTAPVTRTKPVQISQASKIARRDRIVLEHLPLVKAIAVRVHENLPVHVDLDDLVHAGVLGLFDAASKFNPDKQVAFSSYASIASRAPSSTACASWIGHRAICAAVTNKWKPLRANWQLRCSAHPRSLKSRRSWALTSSAGAR